MGSVKLMTSRERPGASCEEMKLEIDINKKGALYFLLNASIGAYNRRTDVIAKQQITLERIERIMSELTDVTQAVADDMRRIGTDVKAVLDLLSKPNPDVAAVIATLKEVDAGLDAAADAMEAVIPPAPTS